MLSGPTADRPQIVADLGPRPVDDLSRRHRLWSRWLRDGRVRKFAFIVEKVPTSAVPEPRQPATSFLMVGLTASFVRRRDPSTGRSVR